MSSSEIGAREYVMTLLSIIKDDGPYADAVQVHFYTRRPIFAQHFANAANGSVRVNNFGTIFLKKPL